MAKRSKDATLTKAVAAYAKQKAKLDAQFTRTLRDEQKKLQGQRSDIDARLKGIDAEFNKLNGRSNGQAVAPVRIPIPSKGSGKKRRRLTADQKLKIAEDIYAILKKSGTRMPLKALDQFTKGLKMRDIRTIFNKAHAKDGKKINKHGDKSTTTYSAT